MNEAGKEYMQKTMLQSRKRNIEKMKAMDLAWDIRKIIKTMAPEEVEALRNYLNDEFEKHGIPEHIYTDRENRKKREIEGRISHYSIELMKQIFFSLLQQASDDGADSYRKMASWIRKIPEFTPFSLSDNEFYSFQFALTQSVPVEDEDALEDE